MTSDLKLFFKSLITVSPPFPSRPVLNVYTSYSLWCKLICGELEAFYDFLKTRLEFVLFVMSPSSLSTISFDTNSPQICSKCLWYFLRDSMIALKKNKSPSVSPAYNIPIWAYSSVVYFLLNIDQRTALVLSSKRSVVMQAKPQCNYWRKLQPVAWNTVAALLVEQ